VSISHADAACPDAKVISEDMEAYSKYSHLVADVISEAAPAFEKNVN
jgi:DNA polymerase IV